MVDIDLLQRGLIGMLRNDTDLVTALGSPHKILEDRVQTQDFTYPHIRVDLQVQTPTGNGTDRTKLSRIFWTVRAYSEQPSSREANYLISLVQKALFNKQWAGTDTDDLPNFRIIRIDTVSIDAAFRITNRLWMATAIFESELNLVNPA